MIQRYKASLIAFGALFLVAQRIERSNKSSGRTTSTLTAVRTLVMQEQDLYNFELIERVALELEHSEMHCMRSPIFQGTRQKY